MPREYRIENVTVVERWLSKPPRFSRAQRAAHWSSLLPCTTLPPPVGAGTFSLHWRFPFTRLRVTDCVPRLANSWMSPVTRLASSVAVPPCTSWTLPPTVEPPRSTTLRWFSAWTLPITRIALARSVARRSTLTVPCTRVPLSVHVAPCGTRRLSTVTAPSVPRQVRSSAAAVPAP